MRYDLNAFSTGNNEGSDTFIRFGGFVDEDGEVTFRAEDHDGIVEGFLNLEQIRSIRDDLNKLLGDVSEDAPAETTTQATPEPSADLLIETAYSIGTLIGQFAAGRKPVDVVREVVTG